LQFTARGFLFFFFPNRIHNIFNWFLCTLFRIFVSSFAYCTAHADICFCELNFKNVLFPKYFPIEAGLLKQPKDFFIPFCLSLGLNKFVIAF